MRIHRTNPMKITGSGLKKWKSRRKTQRQIGRRSTEVNDLPVDDLYSYGVRTRSGLDVPTSKRVSLRTRFHAR